MADKKFDLGGYVEVKDRIAKFYDLYGQGRLSTTYELTREPDDKPKVIARALAFRTPDDPVPASGTSWMYLPGKTSYTLGSEIENAETSAVGRAIGMLGILIDASIATVNEINDKKGDEARHVAKADPVREAIRADEPTLDGAWTGSGAIGINQKAPADGFLRQEPDGAVVVTTFETEEGKKISQCVYRGSLAVDLLDAAGGNLKGLVCTLSGDLYTVPWWPQPNVRREFKRLEVRQVITDEWKLPVPQQTGPGLFDADLEAELEAELDAAVPS